MNIPGAGLANLSRPIRRAGTLSRRNPRATSSAMCCRPTVFLLLLLLFAHGCVHAAAIAIPPGVGERLGAGQPQDLIVEFDDDAIESEAAGMRAKAGLVHDDAAILQLRATRYRDLKRQTLAALPAAEVVTLIEYSHLPMTFLRVRSAAALDVLSRRAGVRAIFTDEKKFPTLTQSLPLINQPPAAAGTFVTQASVTSDVPDPNSGNNSTSVSIAMAAPAPNDADVPMLPSWGMAAMGLLMLGASGYVQRRRGTNPG